MGNKDYLYTSDLTPEQKQAWLDALRSGNYRQGRSGKLRRKRGDRQYFCCLGVLNDLMGGPSKDPHYLQSSKGGLQDKHLYLDAGAQLALAQMNDGGLGGMSGRAHTFNEIADWIEENVEPSTKE